jgi:hypothetical protein
LPDFLLKTRAAEIGALRFGPSCAGAQRVAAFASGARRRRIPTQKGDKVVFSVSDAFLPEREEARNAIFEEDEVVGTVMDFSDSGDVPRVFALVEVIRHQTLIVPVKKLRLLEGSRRFGAGSS